MKRRRPPTERQPEWRWLAAAGVICAGIATSGVWIASMAHDVRGLFIALEANQQEQDRALAQYSRFLIERGTLSSYQNVDQIAERQLAMRFPDLVERMGP